MKILRSVTRRGFNVGTAGWFSVLKPNTWFPATRLPRSFRYRASQPEMTGRDHAGSLEMTVPPRIMLLGKLDRGRLAPTLAVVAAMAITSALLWWIMHP